MLTHFTFSIHESPHKLMQMYVGYLLYCEYIFIVIFTSAVDNHCQCTNVVCVLSIIDTVLLLKP